MQLIVLGMHRSGTSVLARLLNMMGVYFGPEGMSTGANSENPKGFWERKDVRALNDFALQSAGCDWNRVSAFDIEALSAEVVEEFLVRAGKIVLEMDANRPWFIKEPRLCLLLPLWRRILEKPVCVHIHRSPVEVAASLQTRNRIPIEAGMALWQRYVVSAHAASEGLPAVTVAHRELMTAPMDVVSRLHRELDVLGVAGLRQLMPSEVESFVNEKLYREREHREDLRGFRDASQVALHEAVAAGRKPQARLARPDKAARAALKEYESTLPPVVTPQEKRNADAARKEQALARDRALDAMVPVVDGLKGASEAQGHALSVIAAAQEEVRAAQAQMNVALEACWRTNAEQAGRIATLDAENAGLRDALATRDREAISRSRELVSLREQLSSVSGAKAATDLALEQRFREIAQLTRMVEEAELGLEAERGSRAGIQRQLDETAGKLEATAGEVATLLAKLVERQQETERLREQVEGLHRAGALLEARTRAAREIVATERAAIEAMKTSRSWRITRPVRWASSLFQQGSTRRDIGLERDRDLVRASGLFDDAWYLALNSDVLATGADPIEHYLVHGAAEGRDPSGEFQTRFYLRAYPDVANAGVNPLVHYILHGAAEGRDTQARLER
jgi:hypothetical protein